MRLTILLQFIFVFTACFASHDVSEVTSNKFSLKSPQKKEKKKWTYRTMPDGFKWLPFEDKDGYLGVKDKDGKIIVPTFYNNIEYNDGFFIVKDRHAIYSIYLNTGELYLQANNIVIVNFDKTIKNSPFILCSNKGKWSAMSRNGKILIAEDFYSFIKIDKTDDERYLNDVKDWVFRIGKDGYTGIIDSLGSVIIPLNKYNEIERVWNKDVGITYSYRIYGDTPQSGICTKDGNVFMTSEAYKIWVQSDDKGSPCLRSYLLGNVIEADLNGNIRSGQQPITPQNLVIDINVNSVKYDLVLTPQNKMGVEKDNKIIVPAIFDKIVPTGNSFQVTKGRFCGIYDTSGKCVVPPNKYHTVVDMGKYFSATIDSMRTSLDKNGHEFFPIKMGDITPYFVGKDTIFISTSHENNKRAIFYKGRQLTDYIYRDAGFMTDKNTGQCVGLYVFDDSHRVGLCNLDGKEIIEPLYTDIIKIDSEKQIFYKVVSGKKTGLYDAEGRMIVQPELFDNISISGKKIIATGDDRICEFNFKGKLLSDSHPNAERDKLIDMADAEFEKGNWDKAAKYYGKAIEYRASATLYYNKAVSYYNDKSYNKAVKEFNNCLALDPSQNLIDKSRALIAKARQLQAEKIERRNARIANVLGLVVGVAATAATVYTQKQIYSQQSNYNNKFSSSYQRDTSMDYLLDPNYTMQQVQMQNWRDYMAETDGGKTMSYDEWYALKAQAMAGSRDSDSGGSSSKTSSSSSSTTKKVYASDCRLCYGTGQCRTCEGRGYYYNPLDLSRTVTCPNCHNRNGLCSSCGGTGKKL